MPWVIGTVLASSTSRAGPKRTSRPASITAAWLTRRSRLSRWVTTITTEPRALVRELDRDLRPEADRKGLILSTTVDDSGSGKGSGGGKDSDDDDSGSGKGSGGGKGPGGGDDDDDSHG